MSTTEPIRNEKQLQQMKDFYLNVKPHIRNHTLINFGLNSLLRISDLLNLKWNDVYNFYEDCFRTHMEIIEEKTNKTTKIRLNENAINALNNLKSTLPEIQKDMYIFAGKSGASTHLSRSQAFRIIRGAADVVLPESHIGCHSLRKTFGFFAWKNGTPPAMLMELYNHSSYNITKHYLGIDQNEKDNVFLKINL